jgi:hypothetical protein
MFGGLFRRSLEGGERVSPEPIEIGAQHFQTLLVHGIDTTSAFRSVNDKTRILEHAQMLRDGRPADREQARQLSHREWAFHESFENDAARAVPQRGPRIHFVSNH